MTGSPTTLKDTTAGGVEAVLAALTMARTTAANDDYSKPGTPERRRHFQRLVAMQAASEVIDAVRVAVGDFAKPTAGNLAAAVDLISMRCAEAERRTALPSDLGRRVDVENVLLAVASGKRGPLSAEECRDLAYRLGVPDEHRKDAATDVFNQGAK